MSSGAETFGGLLVKEKKQRRKLRTGSWLVPTCKGREKDTVVKNESNAKWFKMTGSLGRERQN